MVAIFDGQSSSLKWILFKEEQSLSDFGPVTANLQVLNLFPYQPCSGSENSISDHRRSFNAVGAKQYFRTIRHSFNSVGVFWTCRSPKPSHKLENTDYYPHFQSTTLRRVGMKDGKMYFSPVSP